MKTESRLHLRLGERLRFALCFSFVGCSSPNEVPARADVTQGGYCEVTLECAKKLHCTANKCVEPTTPAQQHAVEVAKLERKIAATHKHEAAAFTEDGKRRMRAQRAELQEKMQALEAMPAP